MYCETLQKWEKFREMHEGEERDFVEPAPECAVCPKFEKCKGLVVATARMEMIRKFLERTIWGVTDN